MPQKRALFVIPFVLTLALSSCLYTPIEKPAMHPSLSRLAKINQKEINLRIETAGQKTIGYQFMFVLIPFGRVEAVELEDTVASEFSKQLLLGGLSPQLNDPANLGPTLLVKLNSTKLSGL